MVALGWPGNDYNVISFKEFEQSRVEWSDPQKRLAVTMSELSRASGRKKWKFRRVNANAFCGSRNTSRGGNSSQMTSLGLPSDGQLRSCA